MVYERSIILFTWTISAILISPEVNFTTASNQISKNSLFKHISLVETAEIKQHNQAVSQGSIERNSVIQQSESPETELQKEIVSKQWTGIGIGVTSVFFCIILWILFQPNSHTKTIRTLTNQDTNEQDNTIHVPNDHQVEFEKEVSLPPFFPLKEDSQSQTTSDELTVIQKDYLTRETKHNPNLIISEDIQDLTTKYEPVQVSAENQELVKINTRNNTNIDVVFELIQDLKKSDFQLRRKAIWELALTGDSRSIEPLINIIPEVKSIDKSLIVNAISQIAYRNFAVIYDVLFASLKDANSDVRKDAIRDIVALHESTARINRNLHIMLNDSDKEVRQTAEWALKIINLSSLPQSKKYTVNKAISSNNKSKQN